MHQFYDALILLPLHDSRPPVKSACSQVPESLSLLTYYLLSHPVSSLSLLFALPFQPSLVMKTHSMKQG